MPRGSADPTGKAELEVSLRSQEHALPLNSKYHLELNTP